MSGHGSEDYAGDEHHQPKSPKFRRLADESARVPGHSSSPSSRNLPEVATISLRQATTPQQAAAGTASPQRDSMAAQLTQSISQWSGPMSSPRFFPSSALYGGAGMTMSPSQSGPLMPSKQTVLKQLLTKEEQANYRSMLVFQNCTWNEVFQTVTKFLKRTGMKQKVLAQEIGFSQSTLSVMLRKKYKHTKQAHVDALKHWIYLQGKILRARVEQHQQGQRITDWATLSRAVRVAEGRLGQWFRFELPSFVEQNAVDDKLDEWLKRTNAPGCVRNSRPKRQTLPSPISGAINDTYGGGWKFGGSSSSSDLHFPSHFFSGSASPNDNHSTPGGNLARVGLISSPNGAFSFNTNKIKIKGSSSSPSATFNMQLNSDAFKLKMSGGKHPISTPTPTPTPNTTPNTTPDTTPTTTPPTTARGPRPVTPSSTSTSTSLSSSAGTPTSKAAQEQLLSNEGVFIFNNIEEPVWKPGRQLHPSPVRSQWDPLSPNGLIMSEMPDGVMNMGMITSPRRTRNPSSVRVRRGWREKMQTCERIVEDSTSLPGLGQDFGCLPGVPMVSRPSTPVGTSSSSTSLLLEDNGGLMGPLGVRLAARRRRESPSPNSSRGVGLRNKGAISRARSRVSLTPTPTQTPRMAGGGFSMGVGSVAVSGSASAGLEDAWEGVDVNSTPRGVGFMAPGMVNAANLGPVIGVGIASSSSSSSSSSSHFAQSTSPTPAAPSSTDDNSSSSLLRNEPPRSLYQALPVLPSSISSPPRPRALSPVLFPSSNSIGPYIKPKT